MASHSGTNPFEILSYNYDQGIINYNRPQTFNCSIVIRRGVDSPSNVRAVKIKQSRCVG